jgi:hypothetical protein
MCHELTLGVSNALRFNPQSGKQCCHVHALFPGDDPERTLLLQFHLGIVIQHNHNDSVCSVFSNIDQVSITRKDEPLCLVFLAIGDARTLCTTARAVEIRYSASTTGNIELRAIRIAFTFVTSLAG